MKPDAQAGNPSEPPSKRPTEALAYGALVTAALVWGGSVVGQKWALGSFSPVETSVLRGLGALCILIPLWWWQEGRAVRFTGRDLAIFAVLGLGVLGNHLGVLFGLRYLGAAEAGIIIGASPAITAFLSALLIRDVPFRLVWPGCAVSFAGVALVTVGEAEGAHGERPVLGWLLALLDLISGGGTQGAHGDQPLLGGLLVVIALVSWALYSIGGRRTMERFSPLTVNWTTLLTSILMQIPLLWTDQKAMAAGAESVPLDGWLAVLYLIVFATALGQQAWLYGVHGIGPARAGIFANLIPVSALILSVVILAEPIGLREVVGIVLILAGVWLVNWMSSRRAT